MCAGSLAERRLREWVDRGLAQCADGVSAEAVDLHRLRLHGGLQAILVVEGVCPSCVEALYERVDAACDSHVSRAAAGLLAGEGV